jgi:hypothetical protein
MNYFDRFQSIHARHENIDDQEVKTLSLNLLKPLAAVRRRDDLMAGAF